MIAIITDRSDNGNEFLCLRCARAQIRSGTHTQMEISCNSFTGDLEIVKFPITQCTEYVRREDWRKDKTFAMYKKQAWNVGQSREGRGLTLLPPNGKDDDDFM